MELHCRSRCCASFRQLFATKSLFCKQGIYHITLSSLSHLPLHSTLPLQILITSRLSAKVHCFGQDSTVSRVTVSETAIATKTKQFTFRVGVDATLCTSSSSFCCDPLIRVFRPYINVLTDSRFTTIRRNESVLLFLRVVLSAGCS